MEAIKTMKLRSKYKFKLPKDLKIDYRDYESSILNAAKKIAPDKQVTVYENYFAIDRLTRGMSIALGRAVAKDPALMGWRIYCDDIVFCRLTGEPVNRKEFFELIDWKNQLYREECSESWAEEENAS